MAKPINPPREAVQGVCPVHEWRGDCWEGCLPERVEFWQLSQEMRRYWVERRQGIRPRHVWFQERRRA